MLHQRTAWTLIGIPRPGPAQVKHARTKEATRTTLNRCVGIIDCVSIRALLPPLGPQPRQRTPQPLEALANVLVPRDQPAPAILKVGQRPEPIVLEFEEPLGIVERLDRFSELGGRNRGEHDFILSGRARVPWPREIQIAFDNMTALR
jgi:hypothetical protein